MGRDAPKETHPSYGRISISRVTGGGGKKFPLFASSIFHGETMRITISRASLQRDLNTDWIFGEEELIEVEMSPVQFAELLTSTGPGTPCTILHVNHEQMPRPEYRDKKEAAQGEFQVKMNEIASCLDEMSKAIEEMRTAKSIKKSDLERLASLFSSVKSDLRSGVPFAAKCFDEQMERSVLEAKAEVEAHILHRALRMAEEGMKLVQQLDGQGDMPKLQLTKED